MTDDAELLRRYAREGAEEAFAEVVRRHVDLVYSAALRQVGGDAHGAKDVAQHVFTDLARKAESLARRPVLAGWLFTATRFAAAKIVRAEQRRQLREQKVAAMTAALREDDEQAQAAWGKLRPVIDEAMSALKEGDREAVLLRFFENRALAHVGAKLGLSENAARMRVERALEKLRVVLARRGVTSTSAALGVILANQAVVAAPVGLAGAVGSAAVVGVVPAASAGVFFSFMAFTPAKIISGIVIGVVVLGIGWQQHAGARRQAANRERAAHIEQIASELASLQRKKTELAAAAETLRRRLSIDDRSVPVGDGTLNNPEYVRVFRLARRGEVSLRLFRRLGLSGSEAETMMDLLFERRLANERATQMVTQMAKEVVAVNGRQMTRAVALGQDAVFSRQLEEIAAREVEAKIRGFLGEERYDVYLAHRTPVLAETFFGCSGAAGHRSHQRTARPTAGFEAGEWRIVVVGGVVGAEKGQRFIQRGERGRAEDDVHGSVGPLDDA
jgi:RNA polymerase sigma factor (sigma-70 family)